MGYVVEAFPAFLVEEVLELRRQGAAVVLLAAFRPSALVDPQADALRVEALYFPPRYRGVFIDNMVELIRRPRLYLSLACLLLRHRESLRLLLLAAHFARVAREQRLAHLHGTFGTRTATLALAVARLAGIDFSFTTHAYDIFSPNPSLVSKTAHASFMRTVSEFNRHYLEEHYSGIEVAKIQVVRMGVDSSRLRPAQGIVRQSRLRIVSVAQLIPKKGHSYLIAACARLRSAGFVFECRIVGSGPMHAALERDISDRGLSNVVRLEGPLPHARVREELTRAHTFALACVDARATGAHMDGIPVALMEAMAFGLPVVATRISGIPELVEDGISGLLVEERNEEALAQSLARLLDDPALRARLGSGARRQVVQHYDLASNVSRLTELFTGQA